MVQEVGDEDEEHGLARLHEAVGDGGRQVGLARAAGTGEDQPAPRVLGEVLRISEAAPEQVLTLRVLETPPGVGAIEADAAQGPDVAVLLEAG